MINRINENDLTTLRGYYEAAANATTPETVDYWLAQARELGSKMILKSESK